VLTLCREAKEARFTLDDVKPWINFEFQVPLTNSNSEKWKQESHFVVMKNYPENREHTVTVP
jgi:hypothetical protein